MKLAARTGEQKWKIIENTKKGKEKRCLKKYSRFLYQQ